MRGKYAPEATVHRGGEKVVKLTLPRGQQWFAVIVIAIFVLYLGNRLWTHRDITWHWKEEVQLADGSRMWVEREMLIGTHGGGEPFTSSRGPKSYRIDISSEQGKVIWEFPQAPVILEQGEVPIRWTVIAIPGSCEDERLYGPYIQYEYLNGQWTPRRIKKDWHGKRANLFVDRVGSYEHQAIQVGKALTVEQVKEFNGRGIGSPNKNLVVLDINYKSYCYR